MFRPRLKNNRDPKRHKLRLKGTNNCTVSIPQGTVGLISLEAGYIFPSHLELMRLTLTKAVRRIGKYWIPVFPQQTLTKKPEGVRMGKGRGAISTWVCRIRRGTHLAYMTGLSINEAIPLLRQLAKKLPINCIVVTRDKNAFDPRASLSPRVSKL